MKTTYEISIVNNDIHKNECLSEIINNLEKLEIFADDIFNRINKKVIHSNRNNYWNINLLQFCTIKN